jgi:GxxExxY protein
MLQPQSPEVETIASQIVDACYKVHKALGPGLLESVYETCLSYELRKRGLSILTQVVLPVFYDGLEIEAGLRLDILVENQVIVEIKAVQEFHPVHEAQVITYLKLTGKRLGILVNFNVPLIRDGIKRLAN